MKSALFFHRSGGWGVDAERKGTQQSVDKRMLDSNLEVGGSTGHFDGIGCLDWCKTADHIMVLFFYLNICLWSTSNHVGVRVAG